MIFRATLLLLLTSSPALALQNLNIDFGSSAAPAGPVSSTYAGAAGQPGVWNNVTNFGFYDTPLVDLAGSPTTARVVGKFFDFPTIASGFHPSTFGDDAALLDDWAQLSPSNPFSSVFFQIAGLAPGNYEVYVYSFHASNPSLISEISGPGGLAVIGGGDWSGAHVEGVTYGLYCTPVTDSISFSVNYFSANTPVNGIQLVMTDSSCPPAVSFPRFCTGDGGNQTGCTDCPCNNNFFFVNGTPSGGCRNSEMRTARLLPNGTPSTSNDSLNFKLASATSNTFAILSSGSAAAPANASNPCFGQDSGITSTNLDGLRCVVQNVLRHGTRQTDTQGYVGAAGSSGWGDAGSPVGPSAVPGSAPGQTRYYQVIYREDPTLGCGTGLNTSQGVEVTFVP